MLLRKTINKNFLIQGVFILLFLLTRVPSLAYDEINPDGVNWHYRSEQFVVGLKTLQLEKTYQHYHPGVTLMWLTGIPIELVKQTTQLKLYDKDSFMVFHLVAKYSLVFVQLVLSVYLIHLLSRVLRSSLGENATVVSALIVVFFSFEPFFVGNSRLYHMDTLFSLLLFVGLCHSFLSLDTSRKFDTVLAPVFLALAFLTKSIGIAGIVYFIFWLCLQFFKNGEKNVTFRKIGLVVVLFLVATFAIFPALWVSPIETINSIFMEAERVGIRKGHDQLFLGEFSQDPGLFFYPLVLLLKLTPLMSLSFLLSIIFSIKQIINFSSFTWREYLTKPSFISFINIFYIGYVIVMSISSKKLDRYMLPLFPVIAFNAYFLILIILTRFYSYKKFFLATTAVFVLWFYLIPYFTLYNHLFTYTSVNSTLANTLVAQKPFGIGIPGLKKFIFEKYGDYPTLGFIDTKPMRAIYMNSRIFDIRESGTSNYDLIVLGINEVMPDNVLDSETKYELDSIYRINGLDYWRVYVKK